MVSRLPLSTSVTARRMEMVSGYELPCGSALTSCLDEGFLDIINALLAENDPPQVISTSYGFDTEASLSFSLTE